MVIGSSDLIEGPPIQKMGDEKRKINYKSNSIIMLAFNKTVPKTSGVHLYPDKAAVADAIFKFDKNKYPGVEIVDLR